MHNTFEHTFEHTFIPISLSSRLVHVTHKTVRVPAKYITPIAALSTIDPIWVSGQAIDPGGGVGKPSGGGCGSSPADGSASRTGGVAVDKRIRAGGGESARTVGGKGASRWWCLLWCYSAACDVGVDAVSKVQLATVAETGDETGETGLGEGGAEKV